MQLNSVMAEGELHGGGLVQRQDLVRIRVCMQMNSFMVGGGGLSLIHI